MYPWKVGELAVCIERAGNPQENPIPPGKILTVKEVQPETISTVEALAFIEWRNPFISSDGKAGYVAYKFRPLNKSDLDRLAEKYRQPIHVDQLIKEGMK